VLPAGNRRREAGSVSRYGQLPLAFEANRGQLDRAARFAARGSGYGIFLTRTGATVSFAGAHTSRTFSISLARASSDVTLVGERRLGERVNSFIGSDPARWRTNVPTFERVRFRAVWPGIGAIFHGDNGRLGFDFVLKPGARASEVALALRGDTSRLSEPPPNAYQQISGRRAAVLARYRADRDGRVTQQVGRYDHSHTLIVDPALMYSSYLGGSGGDQAGSVAVDASDHAFVTGTTASVDFPRARAGQRRAGGGRSDSFVAQLSPTGNGLVYSTFLGGNGDEHGMAIAIDSAATRSSPAIRPLPTSRYGGRSRPRPAVAATPTSSSSTRGGLLYSTYLGGGGNDGAAGIAVDHAGNAYVTGSTNSADFPTNAPLQKSFAGGSPDGDAFVTKLTSVAHACRVSDDFTVIAPPFNGLGFEGPKAVTVPTNATVLATSITDTATGRLPAAQPWTGVTWKKSYAGRMRRHR
jgi:hypothetical protein